jgi:ubiquitin carboxyl-terminal hydrolase L5
LDGLQEGPVCLGDITNPNSADAWLDLVRPVIQKRIEKYSASEIRFNLLALIRNRRQLFNEKLAELAQQEQTPDNLQIAEQLRSAIAAEEQKRKTWKYENARRKHNYIPFIVEMLRILAEKKQLEPLIKKQLEQDNQTSAAQ